MIAFEVAVRIVECLEIVDVKQDDRHRYRPTLGARPSRNHCRFEMAAVPKSGQCVLFRNTIEMIGQQTSSQIQQIATPLLLLEDEDRPKQEN